MTTYNTGNPVGSTAVKDMYDNAENLDHLVNDRTVTQYNDRKGVARKTWYGMEVAENNRQAEFDANEAARQAAFDADMADWQDQFDASQADREDQFAEFLLNSGYEQIGDYDADGPLTITRPNQIFSKDGEYWRSGPSLALPYTTINNWTTDEPKFVTVGDAALRQQLAQVDGGKYVGWDRPASPREGDNLTAVADVSMLSIWEYAGMVTSRPTPADPTTWDWTPALNAACAASPLVVIPSPIGFAGAVTLSGRVLFVNTGRLIQLTGGSLIFGNPTIDAPRRQVFQVTPTYSSVTVANTSAQARRITNISGSVANEFVEPEWFGAVPYVEGSAVDSHAALDISIRLGNLHLNALYCVSRAFLVQNKRRVQGTRGRPSDCGLVAAPAEIAFTGNALLYNYEQAGVTDFAAANGENQNPYVYLLNFCTITVGMYRTGTTDNVDAFRQVDLFTWETTTVEKVTTYVRSSGSVATPTMYQIFRHQNGPSTIRDLDIIGVEASVNVDCLADSSVELSKMTNVVMTTLNMNLNSNKALKLVCLKEAPSRVSEINIERHPSRYGGNASTRPSIIAQGPVRISDVKLSTEAASSLGVRVLKRPSTSWEPMPILENIAMQPKPNDVVGYFSRLIEVYDTDGAATLELIDSTYLLSGVTQTQTSLSGVAFFDGGRLEVFGGASNVACHKNSHREFRRNFGTVAAGGTVAIPVPRGIATGNFANIQYTVKVTGRGSGNLAAMHFGYLEGTGAGSSTLRNTALAGGSVWTLTGTLASGVGSLTLTNASAGSVSDVTVEVQFVGTPSTN